MFNFGIPSSALFVRKKMDGSGKKIPVLENGLAALVLKQFKARFFEETWKL